MTWAIAMLVCLVLMLSQGSHWPVNKLKIWGVMVAAWLLGVGAVVFTGNHTPTALWMAIDITSAAFVLGVFRPIVFAQKLIGSLFTMMVVWHVVFAAGDGGQAPLYTWFQIVIGWAQWGVLMMWSLGDGKIAAVRLGIIRDVAANKTNNGSNGR